MDMPPRASGRIPRSAIGFATEVCGCVEYLLTHAKASALPSGVMRRIVRTGAAPACLISGGNNPDRYGLRL